MAAVEPRYATARPGQPRRPRKMRVVLGLLERLLRELLRRLARLLQRLLLVLEVLLQERDDVVLAHRLRFRDQAVVDSDLVGLRLDDARQDHGVVEAVLHLSEHRLAFFLETLDRRARLLVRLLAEGAEDLLEVANVTFGLATARVEVW